MPSTAHQGLEPAPRRRQPRPLVLVQPVRRGRISGSPGLRLCQGSLQAAHLRPVSWVCVTV